MEWALNFSAIFADGEDGEYLRDELKNNLDDHQRGEQALERKPAEWNGHRIDGHEGNGREAARWMDAAEHFEEAAVGACSVEDAREAQAHGENAAECGY